MTVEGLEAKFFNLNPFMQQMFWQLNDMEKGKTKDFLLGALTKEFEGVASEAWVVFSHYKMPSGFPGVCRV